VYKRQIVNLGGSGDFQTHIGFGYSIVGLAALAVLVTAVAARAGRRDIGTSFGLLVLYVIQTVLPQFRASVPSIAALHPLNAMILFALAIWYARRAWRMRFVDAASGETTTASSAAPAATDPT